ncbi:MAG TPA: phosphohistidine phosphatase SixA [Aggregatilineales bacterium]|nr:phosphohistidine phosphatase SixA [Aggregatilineales bacterium]
MNLYLLRHGEAGDPWSGSDAERPLTQEGIRLMEQEAATLARWRVPIEIVLSSPLVRARQTADIAAKALKVKVVEDARLGSGQFRASELPAILENYTDMKHVMLVGHDPDFTSFIHALTGAQCRLKKGGFAQIKLDDSAHGTLICLLTPAQLGAD